MKKLLVSVIIATLFVSLTACGTKSETGKGDNTGTTNQESVNPESQNSENEDDDSTTVNSESEEINKEVITRISEDEAKIVIDGVEFGLNTTWPEFKALMMSNNWTFKDLEVNFPNETKFNGGGEIITPAGIIAVRFMANKDNTGAVIRTVYAKKGDITGEISICGLNPYTDPMLLSGLEVKTETERGRTYCLDDHLFIGLLDTTDGVSSVSLSRDLYNAR